MCCTCVYVCDRVHRYVWKRLTLVVVLQVQLLQRRLIVRLPLLQYVGDIVVGLIRQKSAKEYQAYEYL